MDPGGIIYIPNLLGEGMITIQTYTYTYTARLSLKSTFIFLNKRSRLKNRCKHIAHVSSYTTVLDCVTMGTKSTTVRKTTVGC
jgi:hypothetical protein